VGTPRERLRLCLCLYNVGLRIENEERGGFVTRRDCEGPGGDEGGEISRGGKTGRASRLEERGVTLLDAAYMPNKGVADGEAVEVGRSSCSCAIDRGAKRPLRRRKARRSELKLKCLRMRADIYEKAEIIKEYARIGNTVITGGLR